ncbi:MAG: ribosome biogenesis/translation initiation ATPase RLI [Methanoculleaceae archaeon]
MRIAVVFRERCHPRKCGHECIIYCPRVRTGDETIVIGEDGRAVISEELCVGCGICVKKCPFRAIDIVNLPEEKDEPTHRYGRNGFVLFGLPVPVEGRVTGILGANGMGKSTAIRILTGELIPNLGKVDSEPSWREILAHYSGTELFEYLQMVSQGRIRPAVKPQYIDAIPKVFSGTVRELLSTTDERGALSEYIERLGLGPILDRSIGHLSGGELQRVAIAACLARDADFYFLDEITPYLDIYQRMAAAELIRELAVNRPVVIVEHDLAILDLLADTVHIAYGRPAVFGIMTVPKGVRVGINQYLEGYLNEENVRFRSHPVQFETRSHDTETTATVMMTIPQLTRSFDTFSLTVNGGEIRHGEVVGVVGANGTGKSTFAKLLAGVIPPDTGTIDSTLRISYKPQYIQATGGEMVETLLRRCTNRFDTSYYRHEVLEPLSLDQLLHSPLDTLSGGELQRVAIAVCISRDADLYILDEPSAHLDVEQRVQMARMIRKFAENMESGVMVIDHDIYLIDMISDRLLVFEGEPGRCGSAYGPFPMQEGMNRFLRQLGITFRRDRSGRPRINTPGSFLDREQRRHGEYYYSEISKEG